MINSILVYITGKLNLLVDKSNDNKSATELDSKQEEPKLVLDSQPTFLYSKESIVELKRIFPPKHWKKDIDVTELAFNAGQQDIIRYIEQRLSKEDRKVIL